MDAGGADLDKAQRRMEGIRSGVWRNCVDLADDAVVPGADGVFEQVGYSRRAQPRPRADGATTIRSTYTKCG